MRIHLTGFYYAEGYFWFRIFGYGLHIKDAKRHQLMFSERNGLTRYWKVGGWVVRVLTPNK